MRIDHFEMKMSCRNKKNMSLKLLLIYIFLFISAFNTLNAQKLPDSLKNKSFDYLNNKLDQHDQDSIKAWTYLNAILAKGKKEKNHKRIAKAYENMTYLSHGQLSFTYADSMIYFAKKIKNNDFIANAYLTKGAVYYSLKKYQKALDNYIIASKFAHNTSDEYLKHTTKYDIANIKFYLGFYDEAEVLLKEAANYFKSVDTAGYINSLHSLGLCYNKLHKYDLCSSINSIGLKIAQNTTQLDRDYFIHSEGINLYSKKNYHQAIQNIKQALPSIIKNGDFANETVGYFYIGKSYLALRQKETALTYFKKVDRAFVEKGFIRPDLRENFEILLKHYGQEDNPKLQRFYIYKLMKVDSILNTKFKYVSGKMYKEYDTRKLILAKNEVEKELKIIEKTAYALYITITVLFFLILFLLYRYYINQRTYRQKFEELMQKKEDRIEQQPIETEEDSENKKPDINPEVIAAILKQLESFEKNKKFLKRDLTLVNLAATFNTNTNYLSKVVNYAKHKSYIAYINDLRIDYIVEVLKKDSKLRNYTMKALAEEAGFSTAQHFSKAFYAKTGIYPSYFVTELNREQSN